MNGNGFIYVDDREGLEEVAEVCRGAAVVALDTESNSLHAYREKVCFVQLAVKGRIFLIDTVALRDLSPLAPVFEDSRTIKALHGADYDVVCLRRDFGVNVSGLFDTMIAAQMLGQEQLGLAALVEKHFSVVLDKSLTRHDWGARPVDPSVIPYLIDDVLHLEELAWRLRDEIIAAGCVEEIRIECGRIAALEWNGADRSDPDAFFDIKGAHLLDATGLAVLRGLHELRESVAERQDTPTFRVLGAGQMIEIAARRPGNLRDLGRIPGCTERVLRRLGARLLEAVQRGVECRGGIPARSKTRPPRRPVEEMMIEETLKAWRKSRVEAEGRTPLMILPNHVITRIAAARPASEDTLARIEGLGRNRLARYGRNILEEIARAVPRSFDASSARRNR